MSLTKIPAKVLKMDQKIGELKKDFMQISSRIWSYF